VEKTEVASEVALGAGGLEFGSGDGAKRVTRVGDDARGTVVLSGEKGSGRLGPPLGVWVPDLQRAIEIKTSTEWQFNRTSTTHLGALSLFLTLLFPPPGFFPDIPRGMARRKQESKNADS
jgi:hypothetical protein